MWAPQRPIERQQFVSARKNIRLVIRPSIATRLSIQKIGGPAMAVLDYVITTRAVKQGAFTAEPGPVKFLRVPANADIPSPDHAAGGKSDINDWFKEVQGLADGDENPMSISPKGDVLIFVHGFNNSLDIIMKRQRQL